VHRRDPVPILPRQSRDSTFANLASVGILLVVLGHSAPGLEVRSGLFVDQAVLALSQFVYLFHMPLFFFISGWLFRLSQPEGAPLDYGRFVAGKAWRLLLPYLVITTLVYPIKVGLSAYSVRPAAGSFTDYVRSLVVPWQNPVVFFWFLPTLFLMFLVAPALRWTLRRGAPWREAVAGLGLTAVSLSVAPNFWSDPLNYRGAAAHLVWFWVGMWWRDRAWAPRLRRDVACALLAFAALVILRLLGEPMAAPRRLASAGCGIAACYFGVRSAEALGLRRIPWVDGRSYQIYLLSWFPQVGARVVLSQLLHAPFWLSWLVALLAGVVVPLLLTEALLRGRPELGPLIGLPVRRRGGAAATPSV